MIVGGESQSGCRPMYPEWAEDIRRQCEEKGVAFFMKQMGGHPDKRGEISRFPLSLQVRQMPGDLTNG